MIISVYCTWGLTEQKIFAKNKIYQTVQKHRQMCTINPMYEDTDMGQYVRNGMWINDLVWNCGMGVEGGLGTIR